ncbi:hypothetical protein [Methanoregula sp.]|uniref:hypothetical protein n=1 Tax=Methanoregula sp. TaxID=2052170 RepID=UPI002C29B1F5|nr:hypothetical protein [Methanoregula sp.]HVP97585.1 hypothetical protein [Methanoregula sp.]
MGQQRKDRTSTAWIRSDLPARLLLCVLACALLILPSASADTSMSPGAAGPHQVAVGVYVVDVKEFSVADGTYQTDFYLSLSSDDNISINDVEFMNGHVSSADLITDTPTEKDYRVYATMTANPDLRRYPFDNHTLPIIIEPKVLTEKDLILVIDRNNTGLDTEANLPGWSLTGMSAAVTNRTYVEGEVPYSRATFSNGIQRDTASTLLKFFLPITLIVIVSLASLLMKVSSRLGLNGSMFLAAVLIHWRIADAIPLVAYATFLDFFMIITYATLVMVCVSGILIIKFTEDKNPEKVEQVNYWSIRVIPAISISLYILLFLLLIL